MALPPFCLHKEMIADMIRKIGSEYTDIVSACFERWEENR